MQFDVAIIGGGAAGLMCAIVAGQRGRRVLVVEHANRVGKKILMSGGGRCNFTNLHATPANYLSQNPHFCKSALARYTQWDFLAMVERHRIAWHEKELGQLFCDESSKLIVRMLLDECAGAGVRIATDCEVLQVRRETEGFGIDTSQGAMQCASLVVASGGLSIPKMGASGFGYELGRQFGHSIVPTRAALVPMTLSGKHLDDYSDLSGVTLSAEVRVSGERFRGGFLFTHRGISGPAVLQISSYWQTGETLLIDWLPDLDTVDYLTTQQSTRPAAELKTVLSEILPKRFAQRLCDLRFGNSLMRQLQGSKLREIATLLHDWPMIASGTEGYRTSVFGTH